MFGGGVADHYEEKKTGRRTEQRKGKERQGEIREKRTVRRENRGQTSLRKMHPYP